MPGPFPPLSVAETPAYKNEKIVEKWPILVDHSQSFLTDATFKQKADYKKLSHGRISKTKIHCCPLIYGYSNSKLAIQLRLELHQLFMIAFNPTFFRSELRHSFKNPGCLYFSFLPSFIQLNVE